MPTAASLVANESAKRSASRSSPAARSRSRPSSIARLARPIAATAPEANERAQCNALSSTFVGRHDPVDEADRECLFPRAPGDRSSTTLSHARRDETRQPLRRATAGDDAEQDLRLSEPRRVGRDSQIARQRDFETTAQRVAANRGDHRARNRRDRVAGDAERRGNTRADSRSGRELRDVGARGEGTVVAVITTALTAGSDAIVCASSRARPAARPTARLSGGRSSVSSATPSEMSTMTPGESLVARSSATTGEATRAREPAKSRRRPGGTLQR